MYFESRSHDTLPVSNLSEAVHRIHTQRISSNQVPVWKHNGQRIAIVPDGHIDNPFMEVAIVNLDTRQKLEVITFGWIKTEQEKARFVQIALDDNEVIQENCIVPLDGEHQDRPATFTCACCGTPFRSTIREQRVHDQDAGYGLCKSCA